MRSLVHLSDLHFGRIDAALLEPLIEKVTNLRPDVLVVSGDLTQRARSKQFEAAREFLQALPQPQIVVPGNHDIPLHNVFDRFARPLDKYRRFIDENLEPVYIDDEIAVLGVNTARSATIKDGRISHEQLARLRARLDAIDPCVIKVVVTHHPFDLPPHYHENHLVGRAPVAMRAFAECRVDLLLAGHLHASHAVDTGVRYRIDDYAALAVQAGTATSTRGRGEANSFNLVRIALPRITVEYYGWKAASGVFEQTHSDTFERSAGGWSKRVDKVN